jgi:transcriptional regulator with XRE-family HTH domain
VRDSIKRIRQDRGFTGAQLAALLGALGRPMLGTAVNKIETGARRVDVDDLVAIALALNTTPNRLLLNDPADRRDRIEMTPEVTAAGFQAWAWANGVQTLLPACVPLGRGDATFEDLQREYLRDSQPPTHHPVLEAIDELRSAAGAFMDWADEHARERQRQLDSGKADSDVPLDQLVLAAENLRQRLKQAEAGVAQLLDESPLADQSGYGTAFFASHEVHTQTRQRVMATRARLEEAEAEYMHAQHAATSAADALAAHEQSPAEEGTNDSDGRRRELQAAAELRQSVETAAAADALARAHEAFARAQRELFELRRVMLIRNMIPPQLPVDLAYIDTLRPGENLTQQLQELWTKVSESRMLAWLGKRTPTERVGET